MLDDITKSIKAHLYERIISPLSGAFIISFLAINWKLPLVILSDLKIFEKLDYINNNIIGDTKHFILFLIAYPLLAAFFYIGLVPFAGRAAYIISRKHHRLLKKDQQRIEDETPIPEVEARKLRSDLRLLENALDTEIAKKVSEINQLKEKIISLETRNDQLEEANMAKENELQTSKIATETAHATTTLLQAKLARVTEFLNLTTLSIHKDSVTGNYRTSLPSLRVDDGSYNISESPVPEERHIEDALRREIEREQYFNGRPPVLFSMNRKAYIQLIDDSAKIYNLGQYTSSSDQLTNFKNSLAGLNNLTHTASGTE